MVIKMKEYRQNTKYNEIISDSGEEQAAEPETKGAGGHGNRYSLPYGLCESVGIDTRGMTPREAWDAWTSKTGRTKEDAEREHWGKTADGQKNEKQETFYNAQVGDIITSGGMKLKILDVSKDGEKVFAEILEGKSPSGLRKPGDKILFHKNSPLAQQAQKQNSNEEKTSAYGQKQPVTPENPQVDKSPEPTRETPANANETAKTEIQPTQEQSAETATPKDRSFIVTNHGVDERLASWANELNSMRDYKSGSATASYTADINKFEKNVNELINRYKANDTLTEKDWAQVEAIAARYSSNLANYTNESNRAEASYPSWAVAGPANYNVRKHEAKMSRLRSLYKENENRLDPDHNVYLTKIKNILSNSSIQSDDSNAVAKLQKKYDALKAELENGKAMNAYFRKNGTLVGFSGISDGAARAFDEKHNSGDMFSRQPFMPWKLQNGNAELHRIQGRINELNKAKEASEAAKANPEAAAQATAAKYPKVDGVEVQENAEQMRVQLRFPGKPDDATRTLLKSHGFRWSPSQNAWQRQLTGNGKYAAKQVMETLAKQKQ